MSERTEGIAGKVVVITGASSGLGEATARHLAVRGATVVLGALRVERLNAFVDEITRSGARALGLATDVTDAAQVQAPVDPAVQRYDRLDVMLNNAGLMPHSPLGRRKIDDWNRMIDVNINGVLYGIAARSRH
jgi:NADP-dependent 3-hydroxy acid dehydrogenase YdfG